MTDPSPDLLCLYSCPVVHLKIDVDFYNECLGFDATVFTLIHISKGFSSCREIPEVGMWLDFTAHAFISVHTFLP